MKYKFTTPSFPSPPTLPLQSSVTLLLTTPHTNNELSPPTLAIMCRIISLWSKEPFLFLKICPTSNKARKFLTKVGRFSRPENNEVIGMWVRFDPPFLDFGNTHLGLEVKKEVRIINMHDDEVVDISSIDSPNKYFSIVPPKQRKLQPHEAVTFEVIFLPRKIGNVEQTLFINTGTSKPTLPYPVSLFRFSSVLRIFFSFLA